MKEDRGILARVVPGYQEAKIVMTACRLGIFEALAGKRMTAAGLSGELGLDEAATVTFLDALAALDLLGKEGASYRLSPISEKYLVPGAPAYLGHVFKHQDRMWRYWSHLEDALKGRRSKESFAWDEEDRREYVMAMDANAERLGPDLVQQVDLDGVKSLLDLGGGPGTYSRLFLSKKASLAATIFDQPEIIDISRELDKNREWGRSLCFRSGDFLRDDLGSGYDLVWASNVVHALAPEEIPPLFSRCHRSLNPGGRIVIHDFFLDESGTRPKRSAVFSVHMLVVTDGGRSYRIDEIRRFLEGAGFEDIAEPVLIEGSAIIRGRKGR